MFGSQLRERTLESEQIETSLPHQRPRLLLESCGDICLQKSSSCTSECVKGVKYKMIFNLNQRSSYEDVQSLSKILIDGWNLIDGNMRGEFSWT